MHAESVSSPPTPQHQLNSSLNVSGGLPTHPRDRLNTIDIRPMQSGVPVGGYDTFDVSITYHLMCIVLYTRSIIMLLCMCVHVYMYIIYVHESLMESTCTVYTCNVHVFLYTYCV